MLRTLDSLIAGHGRKFVLARFIGPAQRFASIEASGGIVLLLAMVAALVWVNSPWDESYFDFWHAELALDGYFITIEEDLGHLVNDGLMVIFFFVVGLEIKRELVHGELSSPKKAALPVAAAIGGMAAPAAIYSLFNVGGDGAKGWGIPVATDIAFAMGVLTLLGARAPVALKVFLLALAIADDLGGILIIAVFYTDEIALEPVVWGAVVFAVILVVNRAGVRSINLYVVLGTLFWVAVLKSGIHATVAGVLLAFLTPSQPYYGREQLRDAFNALRARYAEAEERGDHDAMEHAVRGIEDLAIGSESPFGPARARAAPLDQLRDRAYLRAGQRRSRAFGRRDRRCGVEPHHAWGTPWPGHGEAARRIAHLLRLRAARVGATSGCRRFPPPRWGGPSCRYRDDRLAIYHGPRVQ